MFFRAILPGEVKEDVNLRVQLPFLTSIGNDQTITHLGLDVGGMNLPLSQLYSHSITQNILWEVLAHSSRLFLLHSPSTIRYHMSYQYSFPSSSLLPPAMQILDVAPSKRTPPPHYSVFNHYRFHFSLMEYCRGLTKGNVRGEMMATGIKIAGEVRARID